METHFKLLVLLTVCYTCNGHLERFTGFLAGAHHQIHNRVHEVAGAVLGGLNFNVAGHLGHSRPPVSQQPNNGQPETIVVIVEEGGHGNQGQAQPQRPYVPPQQYYNRPPNNGYNPNHEYQSHRPTNPGYNNQRPYGPDSNLNNNGNGSPNQNHNAQGPYNHGQMGQYPNQGGQGNQNQNNYENNIHNGNAVPNQNGNGIPSNNVNNNKPDQNKNEVKNPEQNIPNLNDNYKPTETNYGQQHDVHNAENAHKETSDKTTKKPKDDGPLFVPLNEYTYGGEKITVTAPKRETDAAGPEENEDQFAIDIRLKEE